MSNEFINNFAELIQRYEIYRMGRRKSFKDFINWVSSLHD